LTLPIFIVYYILRAFDILGFICCFLAISTSLTGDYPRIFLVVDHRSNFEALCKIQSHPVILMFVIFLTIFGISLIGGASGDQGSMIPVWSSMPSPLFICQMNGMPCRPRKQSV
jgi:hypothetical protein